MADETIGLLADAQADDGYINTWYQYSSHATRWSDLAHGHELYMAGHLIQAAVAHHQSTGSDALLGVAVRYADLICETFSGDRPEAVPGHPGIEMALIDLYHATGQRKYLGMAAEFIDRRGYRRLPQADFGSWYYPDHVPVRKASTIQGHVVRALYLASAVTGIYLETGEPALLEAAQRQWNDMTSSKLYITGGLGPRAYAEAFGEPYDLPNETAYCETCAAIGSIFWSWGMLRATGDAKYADLIEHTLYNAFLSGISLSGDRFFYANPLATRTGLNRSEWFDCACCPPNVMRLLSSLEQYIATSTRDGIQIHQYIPSSIHILVNSTPIEVVILSGLPWNGNVSLRITKTECSTWNVTFRIPPWSPAPTATVNGQSVQFHATNGYATITRQWRAGDTIDIHFPMWPRIIEANPRVEALTGCVALQRGPLIYCFEQIDQPPAVDIFSAMIDLSSPSAQSGENAISSSKDMENADAASSAGAREVWRDDLLGGVMTLIVKGVVANPSPGDGRLYRPLAHDITHARNCPHSDSAAKAVELTAIPYYAWANRGETPMTVWLPAKKP